MHKKSKALFASFIGTMLEYYDVALYAAFLPKIADHYFASENKDSLCLLVFTLSFFARPLGALVFGYLGDKYGRRKAFGLPLFLMAISTLVMATIPSYATIGIFSSTLIIGSRLIQGFCLGAEYGGALVFALEHHNKKLGITAGLLGSAVLSGSLLANIIPYIFTLPIFPEYFWRAPFIIGSLAGLLGIWVRYNLEESPEFDIKKTPKIPILVVLKQYPLSFIKAASTSGLNGLMGSFIFAYLNFYFVKALKWDLNHSLLLIIYSHIIALSIAPVAGLLSQKYTATKIIKYTSLLLIITILPCLYLINLNNIFYIIIAISILSLLTGICWGGGNLLMYNLFPSPIRYSGVAFSDSIGRILFSAPIPFLCNYFTSTFGYMAAGLVPIAFILLVFLAQQFIYDKHA